MLLRGVVDKLSMAALMEARLNFFGVTQLSNSGFLGVVRLRATIRVGVSSASAKIIDFRRLGVFLQHVNHLKLEFVEMLTVTHLWFSDIRNFNFVSASPASWMIE
jgi:hypothetical protein